MSDVKTESLWLMHGNCLDRMKEIPDGSVDLTVTSPPYDNLRTYNGNNEQWGEHVWKAVIAELYRVTKSGGVVVWVVADATIKGSETGTSFKQALHAMDCGFNLHDTMIYQKNNYMPLNHSRYEQSFEYMFVWSKGKAKAFNGLRIPCGNKGQISKSTHRKNGEDLVAYTGTGKCVKDTKLKNNVWVYNVGNGLSTTYKDAFKHPAIFPEKLANDHILSWSNPDDVVFDCFMCSGTTGAMAILNNRQFIGIEMDDHYFNISKERILATKQATEEI